MDNGEKLVPEHVQRPPLPWRDDALTECGLPTAEHQTITREQFIQKVKSQGQVRSAMTTCMTCWDTARRHPSWQQDPVGCISREVHWTRRDNGLFKRELRAIAALISRHREEFDEIIKDQEEIVPLRAAAKARATKKKW